MKKLTDNKNRVTESNLKELDEYALNTLKITQDKNVYTLMSYLLSLSNEIKVLWNELEISQKKVKKFEEIYKEIGHIQKEKVLLNREKVLEQEVNKTIKKVTKRKIKG